jgi:hypothetical protein
MVCAGVSRESILVLREFILEFRDEINLNLHRITN